MPDHKIALYKFDGTYTIDRNAIEFEQRKIPKDKFVEYEPKDLEWMIPLGMAPEKFSDEEYIKAMEKCAEQIEKDNGILLHSVLMKPDLSYTGWLE